MGSLFLEMLNAGGLAPALNLLAEKLSYLATVIKLPAMVMLLLGAVVAILVGTLGYKYIKLIATACFAIAGYGIGEAIFRTAKNSFGWNTPDYASIIAGVVLLALLGFLAYKKIAYALFGVAGLAGFALMYFIFPNYLIAVAVGVVVALLAMYFVRRSFIFITSFSAGLVLMALISAMAPTVKLLQLSGLVGKILAIIVSLIFVSIQMGLTQSEAKKLHGPRRVKIRRVFDAW